MKVHVSDFTGRMHALDAPEGWRLMEVLRDYGFPIKAECGGACACATCHVYVDEAWVGRLPEMRADEEEMLDEAFDVQDNSRLSCQIILEDGLDGLAVRLARNTD